MRSAEERVVARYLFDTFSEWNKSSVEFTEDIAYRDIYYNFTKLGLI